MGKTKDLHKEIRKQLAEKLTTVNNCQSPSFWGSTQDLALWDINDDEKGQGSAQYYTGEAC